MSYEAAVALDLRGLAGKFADALEAAGFDFERPSLAPALRSYENWLRKPVRGLGWGESDCAIVIMEPLLGGGGAHVIELRRHLGEPDGTESSIDLQLAYRPDWTPGIHRLPGRVVEALDEPPALWIGGELRGEPAIVGALADDWPFMAVLRIGDIPLEVGKRTQAPAAADPSLHARTEPRP